MQADGYCHFNNATVGAQLYGYVNVTPYDAVALKTALVNEGPISVAIDAGHKSFVFYDNGVFYEPECGNKPDDLDHAVLLVGYGTLFGQDYWVSSSDIDLSIISNSLASAPSNLLLISFYSSSRTHGQPTGVMTVMSS